MLKLKDITDVKLANYIGVAETKTLRNWKKLDNPNFIPATGKHNLYKAAKSYMYLNSFKEINKEECEMHNNFDLLYSAFETLESNLNINTENLNTEIKQAIKNSNNTALKTIKDILEDLRSI
ncbi:hypothetical protein [Aliarcobacter butzleri]|uniref:hypothetical protein n=1 Tax=Aliarcobacter butzleri TaxID=28197 RepID=UPI00125F8187|nr:hypothetical protein [Aliarcobacter butzleri]